MIYDEEVLKGLQASLFRAKTIVFTAGSVQATKSWNASALRKPKFLTAAKEAAQSAQEPLSCKAVKTVFTPTTLSAA